MSTETTEMIKDFPATQAGNRVGWVSTMQYGEGCEPGLTQINMVTATVGSEGAKLSHRHCEDEKSKYTISNQSGFLAISGIVATISPRALNEPMFETNFRYATPERHGNYDGILLSNGVGQHTPDSDRGHREWATGPSDLIDLLKQKMTDAELAELYPKMYYLFNGTIDQEYPYSEPLRGNELGIEDLLMPDSAMRNTTDEQIEIVRSILAQFESQILNDEKMKRDLTVFGTVEASDIADEFEGSRRRAHESELEITEQMSKLALRRLVYVPTGQGKSGRSWPYMDASESNESAAFGQELHFLKEQDISNTNYQLEQEIKELSGRSAFARDAYLRLEDLRQAESQC